MTRLMIAFVLAGRTELKTHEELMGAAEQLGLTHYLDDIATEAITLRETIYKLTGTTPVIHNKTGNY
jgi:hypothetical protein